MSDHYLLIDIERGNITRNHQPLLGMGKMDPFVILTINSNNTSTSSSMNGSLRQSILGQQQQGQGSQQFTRTPTHWDSHHHPVWFHACPKILLEDHNEKDVLMFQVLNDSSLGRVNWKIMGIVKITLEELMTRAHNVKAQSLGLAAKVVLELENNEGTLTLSVRSRSKSTPSLLSNDEDGEVVVDPSWFEHPVQRLGVSGGTAPFFALQLTPKGLGEVNASKKKSPTITSTSYYIGKDLSHAEDEKDFYTEIRHIAEYNLEQEGVGLLVPYMFDYLGVLSTKTADTTSEDCQLLVMQNLRNSYEVFRMLDLKMGQQTAQANWQGKSRFRAMKQNVLDGMTNSTLEGYRLEGFDGSPQRIDSMDPLMDLLSASTTGQDIDNECGSSQTLLWGKQVSAKDIKKARRIMFQTFTGADIFRYFLDLHLDKHANENPHEALFSVEVAEIVLHELVSRLVHLALQCHKLEIPQKWIGSSVALGYDAGLFPHRGGGGGSSDDHAASSEEAEAAIRSKVIVNVFDWGRSELLTMKRYQNMTDMEKQDRQQFWENYKDGMDRLAYNATREYYHRFTRCERTTTDWTTLTLQVMDFDSMTADDYMGKVDIVLPNPMDASASIRLQERNEYQLQGVGGTPQGSIVCSISWLEFPTNSRMAGTWRVLVERASNLPIKDTTTKSSDPYVVVIAKDGCNHRNLQQMTCVKARNLNPIWNETIDIPVMKSNHLRQAMSAKGGMFDDSFPPEDRELARLFEFRDRGQDDLTYWTACLKKAAAAASAAPSS